MNGQCKMTDLVFMHQVAIISPSNLQVKVVIGSAAGIRDAHATYIHHHHSAPQQLYSFGRT